jgi:hypothetical protein
LYVTLKNLLFLLNELQNLKDAMSEKIETNLHDYWGKDKISQRVTLMGYTKCTYQTLGLNSLLILKTVGLGWFSYSIPFESSIHFTLLCFSLKWKEI